MTHANLFTPTEAQRRALDRLWRAYDRAVKSHSTIAREHQNDFRVRIEETIVANLAGFDTPEDHRNG